MKKINIVSVFLLTVFMPAALYASGENIIQDSPDILRAMQAEMSRSVSRLQMDNLQKPYFMAYTVSDSAGSYFSAEFGAITSESVNYRSRRAKTEVRIGNKAFDSSLYVGNPYGDYEPVYGYIPVDGGYDSVRFSLWQLTDSAYKSALDSYAKKQAFVQSKNITELYDDLIPAVKTNGDYGGRQAEFNTEKARDYVRGLSGIFKKYPHIKSSGVNIFHRNRRNYFLNSEGTWFTRNSCVGRLGFSAAVNAADGHIISASDSIEFCDAGKELPAYTELEERVRKLAERLSASVESETVNAYIGPVLFEKKAAGKFFENLFVNNVANPREIWKAESQWAPGYIYSRAGELDERLGMRVLPPFLNVYDDPSVREFEGKYLSGSYIIDDEGVPVSRVELVSRGILKDYYRFRAATRDFNFSNGHGRADVNENVTGAPGNVFIEADEKSPYAVPASELKSRLIELCREQEIEYGFIVRDLGGMQSRFNAVRVYTDGHEEPAHSLVFTGTSLRALRDIVYVSKERNVYSLGWSPEADLIHPDILVREMEIKKSSQKPPKKTYLEHPYFSGKK